MFCVSFWCQKLTHYISFWGQRFLSQKLTFYVSFWSQKLTLWVSFWSQKLIHNNGFWIRYNKINFDLPSIISQDFISPRDSCPRRHLSKETFVQGDISPRKLFHISQNCWYNLCQCLIYLVYWLYEKKNNLSKVYMTKISLDLMSPWTNVSFDQSFLGQLSLPLEKCLLDKHFLDLSFLGLLSHVTMHEIL